MESVGATVLTVSIATQRCHQLLKECLDIRLLMDREWVENKLADFNLWANGIGAAATETDRISLDARLGGKPTLLNVFIPLLQMLIGFLKEAQTLTTTISPDELEQHLYLTAHGSQDDRSDGA